jgi:hypothetical protein
MKREADFFDGHDPQLIYIAKRLDDALHLEETLTQAGVDYGVEADRFTAGVIFRSERVGAFFYVLPKDLEAALGTMRAHGYRPVRSN